MASFRCALRPSRRLPLLCSQRAFASTAASRAVAVFWDLNNKPPKSIPPYDAAVRLHLAAASFGPFRFSVAYANHQAFRHVPAPVRAGRALRRAGDRRKAASPSPVPYLCRVCGRRFYVHAKLVNHFRQIHEHEQEKRLRRIESAKGGRRVRLLGALSMKMHKYEKAARELLNPEAGYRLADELLRAGVVVRTVEDLPEAANRALRDHMVETMDRGKVGCLMLVSDDAGFLGVIREARTRCLKTVVVGHEADGVLRRSADAALMWKDVVSGKAKKAAPTTVGKWVDKDLLKKLEWRYEPGKEAVEEDEESDLFDDDSDSGDEEEGCLAAMGKAHISAMIRDGGSCSQISADMNPDFFSGTLRAEDFTLREFQVAGLASQLRDALQRRLPWPTSAYHLCTVLLLTPLLLHHLHHASPLTHATRAFWPLRLLMPILRHKLTLIQKPNR